MRRLLFTRSWSRRRTATARASSQVDVAPKWEDWAVTDHEVVKRIIIRPNFGQSLVTLERDNGNVASWPGSVRSPDSSAPQPPGGQPTGPVEFRVRFNPLRL